MMNLNAEYLPKNDPIMQELWAVKAQINKEAGYSVDEIVRRMLQKYPPPQTPKEQGSDGVK
jgi:hypothetical protein